ncbi:MULTISPECIES: 2Fe-2S iron-sulfur cluster-binding protein [Vibrio]|uniref:2Fe-2S iron-sulfur cluster binding domain-containing protein n=2 Tax=Vibrio TaxID=662 RepID=A0A7X4LLP5_9VIBR|nr:MULTISPECIES: 2Fe-2S iron-sulfur cluster-binding protein [Vibrio]MBF9001263.1 2Fe-2S iron-sulfur cluster binding domain-containing protein [Vibrio nitrifigilis]MZI94204.1 2Fe-2S iron-sulfur cluster binding domain-containing protein [Vibrio eleionomae]
MSHTVLLLPNKIQFTVSSGQTILEAALNQQISFPNRCQVGACAACLCKKVAGKVSYQLEPMLTDKERESGWVFACQAIPESDLVLTFEE